MKYMDRLIFVDCEAPFGCGSPAVGNMTEFGAVCYRTRNSFHGHDHHVETFAAFREWLENHVPGQRPVFVSDNPAYDWQWINYYFHLYFGKNPFGFSARRIGDFYAGVIGDFCDADKWKQHRITKHDHNPVNDAMGNVEAFEYILKLNNEVEEF